MIGSLLGLSIDIGWFWTGSLVISFSILCYGSHARVVKVHIFWNIILKGIFLQIFLIDLLGLQKTSKSIWQ